MQTNMQNKLIDHGQDVLQRRFFIVSMEIKENEYQIIRTIFSIWLSCALCVLIDIVNIISWH